MKHPEAAQTMEQLSTEIAVVTGMAPSTIREQFLRMLKEFVEVSGQWRRESAWYASESMSIISVESKVYGTAQ